jgi:hypothetical protein
MVRTGRQGQRHDADGYCGDPTQGRHERRRPSLPSWKREASAALPAGTLLRPCELSPQHGPCLGHLAPSGQA